MTTSDNPIVRAFGDELSQLAAEVARMGGLARPRSPTPSTAWRAGTWCSPRR
jgi:hypothetical protein